MGGTDASQLVAGRYLLSEVSPDGRSLIISAVVDRRTLLLAEPAGMRHWD
jgi:hypothetical protein